LPAENVIYRGRAVRTVRRIGEILLFVRTGGKYCIHSGYLSCTCERSKFQRIA